MRLLLLAVTAVSLPAVASAVNPAAIQRGQQLFTQPFSPTPPGPGGDGLGPLFNHVSCVACHHSGGVGGAGDHRFNARALGISELHFAPRKNSQTLGQVLGSINPLLLSPDGNLINAIPIHRHGGSAQFDYARTSLIARFNPSWDSDESINSDAIRAEAIGQIVGDGNGSLRMQTHIFARNTTALFGAGLIDRVPDSVIMQQVKAQKRFPEINGRPATLADGRIGKFGWRANFATLLEFNENACVNELGLQTKRVPQTSDPTNPQYNNPKPDIDDQSIQAMTHFIAALPAPTRAAPVDSGHGEQIALGENRFAAIGCAVCHIPNLGPARGIYSDLLLHDMGPTSIDYSAAPPYRKTYEEDYEEVSIRQVSYYGATTPIAPSVTGVRREFIFRSPERPSKTVSTPINLGRDDDQMVIEGPALFRGVRVQAGQELDVQRVIRSETIPTNFTQEWRTPPLWGLRDSAPYMHDGRAETILEAIAMHDGEAARTRNRFYSLSYDEQLALVAFLESFVAPTRGIIPAPKDFTSRDVASN